MTSRSDPSLRRVDLIRFVGGVLAGLIAAVLLGEAFSRISAPADLKAFLGESSPRSGAYRPDPDVGVAYRSLADFRAENAVRLRQLEKPGLPSRTWLWFGNSFVQA